MLYLMVVVVFSCLKDNWQFFFALSWGKVQKVLNNNNNNNNNNSNNNNNNNNNRAIGIES